MYDTQDGGLHIHNYSYPYNTVIHNNIFAFSQAPGFVRNAVMSNLEKPFGVRIDTNINYNHFPEMLGGAGLILQKDPSLQMFRNCYWSPDAGTDGMTFKGVTLAQWQKKSGVDSESIAEDPRFMDPEKRDFRLQSDSPVFALGFENFDVSTPSDPEKRAGLTGTDAWRKMAEDVVNRPCEKHTPYKNQNPYLADFEGFEADELPTHMQIYTSGPAGALESTERTGRWEISGENPHSGEKSLKIIDAPDQKNSYDPHVTVNSMFPTGKIVVNFFLYIQGDAFLQCETRQYSVARQNYETGPTFQIHPNGDVAVDGRILTKVPHDCWVEFSLEFQSGTQKQDEKANEKQNRNRTWTLKVRPEKMEKAESFKVPLPNSFFKQLEWVGILSLEKNNSEYFLDDFEVKKAKSSFKKESNSGEK